MYFFFKKFRQNKNKKFFITADKKFLSYNKFYNYSLNLASIFFLEKGSLKNKRVLVNTSRSIDYFIILIALIRLGAVIIPISNKLTLLEINYIKKTYKPYFEINKAPTFKNKLSLTKLPNYENDSKIIFFTSGTTGKPKGIQHKTSTLFLSASEFSKLSKHTKNDIILHNWPHYYMAGFFNMFLCPLVSGSSIFFGDEIGVETYLKYWKFLHKNKITKSYLSPTMAQALINYSHYNKTKKNSNIQTNIFSTGAFLYKNIFKNFKKIFGISLKNCYGITEVGGSFSVSNKNESNLIGKLSKGVTIKLSKKNEIMIRSKFFFEGYLTEKGKIKKFDKKYFISGDLGKKNKSHYYIIGRNKEIIKKGGEQISLLKIEDVALTFEKIKDAIARGVRSEFWGEEIELDIIFKDEKNVQTKNNLRRNRILLSQFSRFLSHKLTINEMPKKISIVKHIPKTSIGKNFRQIF